MNKYWPHVAKYEVTYTYENDQNHLNNKFPNNNWEIQEIPFKSKYNLLKLM